MVIYPTEKNCYRVSFKNRNNNKRQGLVRYSKFDFIPLTKQNLYTVFQKYIHKLK